MADSTHPRICFRLSALILTAFLRVIPVEGVNYTDFDCSARLLAYQYAAKQLGHISGLQSVADALRLEECPTEYKAVRKRVVHVDEISHEDVSGDNTLYVSATRGSDRNHGSLDAPFKSIHRAVEASREINAPHRTVAVMEGRYLIGSEVTLGQEDNGLSIVSFPDTAKVVLSGATEYNIELTKVPEDVMQRLKFPAAVMQGQLPSTLPLPGPAMFMDTGSLDPTHGSRFTVAREPNGDPERDLQPTGYGAAAGSVGAFWPSDEGSIYSIVATPVRNNTVYPIFGRDWDPRDVMKNGTIVGWQWRHIGGTASRYGDNSNFFNGSVPTGMRFNTSATKDRGGHNVSAFSTKNWTTDGAANATVHLFHPAFWGNWQFELKDFNTSDRSLKFGRGGFQEAHGGGIGQQPFYVEGVREALDRPGEYWVDPQTRTLYIWLNDTVSSGQSVKFMSPTTKTLIGVRGASSQNPGVAANIHLKGLTFSFTGVTYLDPYIVPSPGDWSIHRGGTVFLSNTDNISITSCSFVRVGGNGVFLSGHAWNTNISGCDFNLIGDSAIATVGNIDLNDGVSSDAYPLNTHITKNHIHEIGVTGKQSSALFSATSCRTTFMGNVAYNGPRAGINLNDAFCHGHRIESNVLFNWVRETQDHGPINTWNRAAYMHVGTNSTPTLVPEWTHISSNFIMNGPSGNRDLGNLFPTIDNDDGSAYFSAEGNVLVYGGAKNYLGHDKRWVNNLILFPDRWSGNPCAQLWGGENHYYVNNECILGGVPRNIPDPLGLDGTRKGFHCVIDPKNKSNAALLGHTSGNIYHTFDGQFKTTCGNATNPVHNWTLAELNSFGMAMGSVVTSASGISVAELKAKAEQKLFKN